MRKRKKDTLAAKASYEHARQAEYEDAIRRPRPGTWPARMPAYAGTVLCPVAGGIAEGGENGEGGGKTAGTENQEKT